MSNELTTAVEKFMEKQGPKSDQKADAPIRASTDAKPNILIAMPCYGGNIHCMTVNMLMSLTRLLTKEGIPHETHFVVESLVPRARNQLASVAAFSTDGEGRPFTNLLYVDADLSFDAGWVLKMLDANLPVVCLPCSRKELNLALLAEAAKRNINPSDLLLFAGSPVFAVNDSFKISDTPVPVVHCGTGVMMISVEKVLKPLVAMHPERKYKPNIAYDKKLEWNFDFFRCGVRGSTYLSEDYQFNEDCLELGIQTHILPLARTTHVGSFPFLMDMNALGSLLSALQGQNKAAQPA
jgi:hypothetical protein